MLVKDAIAERDELAKKIDETISGMSLVNVKLHRKAETLDNLNGDQFNADTAAEFANVIQMIKRHSDLNEAILASDSREMLDVPGFSEKLSRAQAISMLNSLSGGVDLMDKLFARIDEQIAENKKKAEAVNEKAEAKRAQLMAKFNDLSEDGEIEPIEKQVVDEVCDGLRADILDPLNIAAVADRLRVDREATIERLRNEIKNSQENSEIAI